MRYTTSLSKSRNKPIAELIDCYQPSLWHIVKAEIKKGRETGGWTETGEMRERDEGKGGAAKETKVL